MIKRSAPVAAAAAAWLSLAALVAAVVTPARAQGAPEPASTAKRPKICLVLSGGGARGAAHVGVIKVLEEYRVPIDCIAGTSMGALVGGAYATGMSVSGMEQINASMSVERVFKETPPRQELAMRRKLDDYRNYFSLEIGTASDAARIGKGLVSGVQLETMLRELAQVQGYFDFDQLPIPYRAVATDLVTGKEVVFREGELANVMRASMSVPAAVAPAEYNGMLLVDGMLTDNLPVGVARAMGADIVIAVNVGTPLLKREQLNSLLGVAGQMINILTEQNVQRSLASLKETDILISPELGDFSTGDFDQLSDISPLGEAAARKMADRLAQLSLPPAEYAALRQRQQLALSPDQRPVDEIRFLNLKTVNPAAAQALMVTQPGKPLVQAELDADMRRLYGTGDFEHVNYRIFDDDGRRVLSIDAVEKAWGPDYLRFGVALSSDLGGEATFDLLASHRMTWLNPSGAELRADLQLGQNSGARVEFFQPFSATSDFFVAPSLHLSKERKGIFSGDQRVAIYDVRNGSVSLDLGYNVKQRGELRLGVDRGRTSASLNTGLPQLWPTDGTVQKGALTLSAIFDQVDSVDFPREGWSARAQVYHSLTGLGADNAYTKWQVGGQFIHSFGETTFRFSARGGGAIGSKPLPRYEQFQWGGFLAQSGYSTGQLIGQRQELEQLMIYRRIFRSGLLQGTYGGVSLESGKVGKPLVAGSPTGRLYSLGVFFALDTVVGPIYLGYGRAEDQNQGLYFYLGTLDY